jgi:hypothetical protein
VAFGNKVPLLIPSGDGYREAAVSLVGNFNAIAFDFVARQKVQGQTLNLFIIEQLPVIPPDAYTRRFGALTAGEIVAREVLALTYTAHDMAPFARDLGYLAPTPQGEGDRPAQPGGGGGSPPATTSDERPVLPPFRWDEADRRQRRARLDALYFHLYGIGRHDADYILSTFPIVRRHDEAAHGRFLTRDLILAHMAALEAGDTEAIIVPR